SVKRGVRASLTLSKTGDVNAAMAQTNNEFSPHLSFIDWGGPGYTVGRVSSDGLIAAFVCIPRPIERSTTPDGGPLAYRVRHRAKLWKASEAPALEQTVVEGMLPLST